MKKLSLLVLAGCLSTSSLLAQTADDYVTMGRTNLAAHNLAAANADFNTAVTLSPNNANANALLAVTRLLVLPQQPAGSNFLNRIGFSASGRDLFNWTATLPQDTNGDTVLPANYNSSEALVFYRTNIMVALAQSRTNLARITDPAFTLSLTADETSSESVTVDYGDILLLQALERAGEFAGYTLNAHNFSVVINHLRDLDKTNGLTIQRVLADYPSLLTQSSASDLAASKAALTNAISLYFAASDFIRNIRAPGVERLFELAPDEINNEAQFRTELTNTLLSLNGPVIFDTNAAFSLSLSNYFTGAKTLRSLTPQFNGNRYINNTLPDYTFGGILVGEPACEVESLLREILGRSYAGIYIGDMYDYYYNYLGSYAVIVRTNQQATVVGYDESQENGIYFDFKVDDGGYWEFYTNDIHGWGNIYKDGFQDGEVDSSMGTAWLQGERQPALGSFQNAAGYYTGTWIASGKTGQLRAVLSADGRVYFCEFDSDGPLGDGGSGQINSLNHFTGASMTGTELGGTLSGTTLSGNFTNDTMIGTFSFTRSANVPFDLSPVITVPPTNRTVPLGTNVTFNVTATGSPPLCYQWFSNDVAIAHATSTSLVLSNVTFACATNYSVSVRNCAGEADATFALIVVPETAKPTIQIVTPTAGLQVSNANYIATGRATDNVQVSGVWYQLNTSGWNPASLSNGTNWTTANLTLTPGTNVIQAYAVDSSGNLSTTNSVSFVYVLSAVLTVNTNGYGTISPNYNGTLLQIGKSFSMTATAGTGFSFAGWTGSFPTNGAILTFTMASNLAFTANFADVTKPTLSITNLTAGQRVSNAVFTVRGTAGDNWQLGGVQYQLNGASWSNAAPVNNWTNWSAGVTFVPGTNVVQAYAMDTTGNKSITNSVSVQFVVTNQLGVRARGLGTLYLNYSNAWLEIGRNYTMLATPGVGFIFTNWMISTNWIGGVRTNNATVQFMMKSNLTLQVSFTDVTKPTLTITAPYASQKMTNALGKVTGTTTDNWGVTNVWYQWNTNAWSLATSTNGYTNWTVTLPLVAGTNTIKAFAVDLGANASLTNSVSFYSSNSFQLQLGFNPGPPMAGNGLSFSLQVSPGLVGRIEASTNLANWTTLTNFAGTNATVNFRDAAATNLNHRFYRAVTP